MPTPASHSSSDGQTRSSFANAWRAELRMSSMESMSVPSRSKRTVGGDVRGGTGMAINEWRRYHAEHGDARVCESKRDEETPADADRVGRCTRRDHDRRVLRFRHSRPRQSDAADLRGG